MEESFKESVKIALLILGSVNLTLVFTMFIKETKPFVRPLVALTSGAISTLCFVYGNWPGGICYLFVALITTLIIIDDLNFLGKLKESSKANIDS